MTNEWGVGSGECQFFGLVAQQTRLHLDFADAQWAEGGIDPVELRLTGMSKGDR